MPQVQGDSRSGEQATEPRRQGQHWEPGQCHHWRQASCPKMRRAVVGRAGQCPRARDSREHLCARWGWSRAGTGHEASWTHMGGKQWKRTQNLHTGRQWSQRHQRSGELRGSELLPSLSAPVHGNIYPDTHRARKPHIHTLPHSCPKCYICRRLEFII